MYAKIISTISSFIYKPYIVPLFLIAAGIYFTCRSKGIQIRLFKEMFKVVSEKPKDKNGMSSFGALMVSTASRVGTGNVIGVSAAICTGGAGALFWMWLSAILGGASAFVESTLAQIYKKKDKDGSYYGGPSYYMESALNARWLGIIFAIIIILTYAVGYNMLAAYNLQSCFQVFDSYDATKTPLIIGILLAIPFIIVVLGGSKRLTKVTGMLVPVMGAIYILLALVIVIINFKNVGAMFASIFSSAFDFKAIFGGFLGSSLMNGIKRGLYSNEAGMGSAPNAAACADVSHPIKQGLVQMLSVFIDTLLICTATGFMLLSSDIVPDVSISGAVYVQEVVKSALGNFGPIFIIVALSLFAFTTLIGNYYYCEGCLRFIMKKAPSKTFMLIFRIVCAILVLLGAILTASLAWDTADMLQGFMVLINIPVIVILSKKAFVALEDYVSQKKLGKNPEYVCSDKNVTEWK